MRLVERMLLELNSTFDGDAWHGTPLRRMLDDVDEIKARSKPSDAVHSIAELLAHITAWIEIVQRRLGDERVEVTPELDFPDVAKVSWRDAIGRLERAHSLLVDTVARMKDSDFDEKVPGKSYTVDFMLHGLVHHNTYHAAQIALLKKLEATSSPRKG